ncbi:MAG: hypothetical protein AAFW00_27325 [Bacteroidota bacterium]
MFYPLEIRYYQTRPIQAGLTQNPTAEAPSATNRYMGYWSRIDPSSDTSQPMQYGMYLVQAIVASQTFSVPTAIDIVFIEDQSLFDRKVLTSLLQEEDESLDRWLYRRTTDSATHQFKKEQEKEYPRPIIFIGTDDIMEVEAHPTYAEDRTQKDRSYKEIIQYLHRRMDPRFRFMDSSIWHRYLSLFPTETFIPRLNALIQDIANYYDKGLYQATIAREYLEFQCRKLRESYVKDYPGGHAKKVTPFRFHSESKMKALSQGLRDKIRGFQWSCLLVDDYAHKGLRKENSDKLPKQHDPIISKKEWIDHLINTPDHPCLKFLNEESIQDSENGDWISGDDQELNRPQEGFVRYFLEYLNRMAKRKEGKERPDIIILDYFFGIEELNPEQQYGHKFIKQLREGKLQPGKEQDPTSSVSWAQSLDPRTRAFGKYWIFPISAFEYAFRSHLRLMGDSTNLSYIEIGDGADPINSPELFKYLFFGFLNYQKEQITINLEEVKSRIEFELELLESGTDHGPKVINYDTLKRILARYYYWMLNFTNRLLKLNREQELSKLAQSYMKDEKEHLLEAAITHFQDMIYMIIYGSNLDLPRIEMRYKILKKLEKQASSDYHGDAIHQNPISQLLNKEIMDSIAHEIGKMKRHISGL